jgi:molybdopterin molybdotransferase
MAGTEATLTVPERAPPLPVDRAVDIVLAEARRLGVETVPLNEALGRVLGEPVQSADDVPPFDNSAMDGFAVRAADTDGATSEAPVELRLAGESRAGAPADGRLGPGEAMRISTGAMLPQGADAVVRMEEAEGSGGSVAVRIAVEPGHDARRAGEDVRTGDVVVGEGTRLGPAELGVLASVGVDEVRAVRRPVATVLTTGDELVPPGRALPPGGIRNTNAFTVPAQARMAGCRVSWTATVPDDAGATEHAVRLGLGSDLLVICGGVSVGPHDHVKPVLAKLGVDERFWGIALRPGRPTWFGIAERDDGHRALVFGLPGNPVSAMITFHLLARPAVEVMLGRAPKPRERIRATLAERYEKPPGRLHVVRCTLELREDGWRARPTGAQESHVLTSMLGAEALAMIEAERGDVEAGETVEVERLSYW